MDLNPVGIIAVLILERGDGGSADFVDDQRTALQNRACAECGIAFLRVVIPRRILIGDDVVIAADPSIAHVVIHRGNIQLLEGDAVASKEEELVARGGELEFGVERFASLILCAVGRENDDVFACRKCDIRKNEGDLVRSVRKTIALEVDGVRACVGQLNPIRKRACFIRKRTAVGGHGFRDAQIGVAAGHGRRFDLCARNVGGGRLPNLRCEENEQNDRGTQCEQQRQCAARRLDPFNGTVLSARRTGIFHPVGIHELTSFQDSTK